MSRADPLAERWAAVQRLVDGALDLAPAEREHFLHSATEDPELRQEAERLLRSCERLEHDPLFATPAAAFAAPLLAEVADIAHDRMDAKAVAAAVHRSSGGRYTVDRQLARGGMATIYLARDLRHERDVAIKVFAGGLVPDGAERFLLEVRTTARLTHPHILAVHDSGECDGYLYYVMPFAGVQTLRDRLRQGPLPLPETLQLLQEVAEALACAHAQGIVHRDLKPENVLISGGHAVVSDFGIARAFAAAADASSPTGCAPSDAALTLTGAILGTPAYMAPEQAQPGAAIDARADLYALGVMGWEALCGEHPFGRASAVEMLEAHRHRAAPSLTIRRRDVPRSVDALLLELMAKDPAARPASADAVAAGLRQIRNARPHLRRTKAVAAVAALALLLGSGMVATLMRSRSESPRVVESGNEPVPGLDVRSIAVLPLTNTSGTADDAYFSDGLTDELATALAAVPGLRIAGRTSSYSFRESEARAEEIGRILDVDAILSGSARRAGNRVRVAIQLVGTADGSLLWSRVFESRSSDVFAVQDELTRNILAALRPSLRPDSGALSAAGVRGTRSTAAYDLYLRGRFHWLERGEQNIRLAVEYFQRALLADPSFARAQAGLAHAYNALPVYVPLPLDSIVFLVTSSAQRAMELDSMLADSRIAMAAALEREFRFAEAERHYRAALEAEPANVSAHHFYGFMLAATGRTREAIAELDRAAHLDPLAKSAAAGRAYALSFAGRFDEARAGATAVLALDSTFMLAHQILGLVLVSSGLPDSAVTILERGYRLHPSAPGMAVHLLYAYVAADRWPDARALYAALRAAAADDRGRLDAAVADLIFGDREPLVRLTLTDRGLRALYEAYTFGCNPVLEPLRQDARYLARVRRLGVADCAPAST